MFFKNLTIFKIIKELDIYQLEEKLTDGEFQECHSSSLSSIGWSHPLGKHGKMLTHAIKDCTMICMKRQEKILPAGVINEKVDAKAQLIEQQENRKLTRKERQALKEDITFELIPRALTRSTLLYAYIDTKNGWIIVNNGSSKRAEELISLLRETIGSVPVIPLSAKNIPIQSMTHWLLNYDAPGKFEFGADCTLQEIHEPSNMVNFKGHNLLDDEVNSYIKSGMSVTKCGFSYSDKLSFIIDSQLIIKQLKFSDLIHEQADSENADDAIDQFDIEFSIMTLELELFINSLVDAFGGMDEIKL